VSPESSPETMKRIRGAFIGILAVWGMAGETALARPSQRTADHLRSHADSLLGTRVLVDVACLKPGGGIVLEPTPGIALVFAETWDEAEGHAGGEVAVLLARDALDKAMERYGSRVDTVGLRVTTNRLSGILAKSADGILCIDASGGAAVPAALTLRSRLMLRELVRRPGLRR